MQSFSHVQFFEIFHFNSFELSVNSRYISLQMKLIIKENNDYSLES